MARKSSNQNTSYTAQIKLRLGKFNNNRHQNVKVDLAQRNINSVSITS